MRLHRGACHMFECIFLWCNVVQVNSAKKKKEPNKNKSKLKGREEKRKWKKKKKSTLEDWRNIFFLFSIPNQQPSSRSCRLCNWFTEASKFKFFFIKSSSVLCYCVSIYFTLFFSFFLFVGLCAVLLN